MRILPVSEDTVTIVFDDMTRITVHEGTGEGHFGKSAVDITLLEEAPGSENVAIMTPESTYSLYDLLYGPAEKPLSG